MKIGFAIIPEMSFTRQIIDFESRFHQEGGFSHSLGIDRNLPHITLFQGEIEDQFDYISMAQSIMKEIKSLSFVHSLKFSKIEYVEKGWYFLMCDKTELLSTIHNFVLKKISPYIIFPSVRNLENLEFLTPTQYDAILKYNYRYAGEAFCPHITIGRSSRRDEVLLQNMNTAFNQFCKTSVISKITVYKMGQNGAHEESLYEVNMH